MAVSIGIVLIRRTGGNQMECCDTKKRLQKRIPHWRKVVYEAARILEALRAGYLVMRT